mmetsp:Transcript_21813/g.51849  ORF Transcript_21813/g.51849 Transcript_21813/m.51849 type:complete len:238 (-) Transcript_21813:1047-1760(-)
MDPWGPPTRGGHREVRGCHQSLGVRPQRCCLWHLAGISYWRHQCCLGDAGGGGPGRDGPTGLAGSPPCERCKRPARAKEHPALPTHRRFESSAGSELQPHADARWPRHCPVHSSARGAHATTTLRAGRGSIWKRPRTTGSESLGAERLQRRLQQHTARRLGRKKLGGAHLKGRCARGARCRQEIGVAMQSLQDHCEAVGGDGVREITTLIPRLGRRPSGGRRLAGEAAALDRCIEPE